jgi:2'-5' RNA ligase
VAWRVEPDEALMALHHRLLRYRDFQRRPQSEYEPHVTIAFDDLGDRGAASLLAHAAAHPEAFPPIVSWTCDNVALYRQVAGSWLPDQTWRAEPDRRRSS